MLAVRGRYDLLPDLDLRSNGGVSAMTLVTESPLYPDIYAYYLPDMKGGGRVCCSTMIWECLYNSKCNDLDLENNMIIAACSGRI